MAAGIDRRVIEFSLSAKAIPGSGEVARATDCAGWREQPGVLKRRRIDEAMIRLEAGDADRSENRNLADVVRGTFGSQKFDPDRNRRRSVFEFVVRSARRSTLSIAKKSND